MSSRATSAWFWTISVIKGFVNAPIALEVHCPLQKLHVVPPYHSLLFLHPSTCSNACSRYEKEYIFRGDLLLSKGMALWDHIKLLLKCLIGSDLVLLITCLSVLFSAVCPQYSTAIIVGKLFLQLPQIPFQVMSKLQTVFLAGRSTEIYWNHGNHN